MVLTNVGKNKIRDLLKANFTTAGVGLNTVSASIDDSSLFGGGTTVDSCDSSTGWTIEGDALAASELTTSDLFQEGTGCLGLGTTYSTGSAGYYKTVTSYDSTSKIHYLWFYISAVTGLTNATDAIKVTMGTGGFTNSYEYNFDYADLNNGWNSLTWTTESYDVLNGSGLVSSDTDSIKLTFKDAATISVGNARLDYIRYYEDGTMGITDSKETATIEFGDRYWKSVHVITSEESNGLTITEAGDSDSSLVLLSRFEFAPIEKGSSTEIQIDKYYYVD